MASPAEAREPAVPAAPQGPAGVFEIAPEEELLYSLTADGKRKFIRPTLSRGRYWRIRRRFACSLILLYFALPLLRVGGQPAFRIDLTGSRVHLFGATLHPGDNLLLVALGLGLVITIFFVGSTFGRMWCGYTCPQTVYLEFVFRPIEVLLEGPPPRQRRLNAAPWSAGKLAIKSAKWALWILVALLMAGTFVAYFTGWQPLLAGLATEPGAWRGALFAIAIVTTLILFDFGWFRDQMCTIACPYGRLQNVIADRDTILVAYDTDRGEPKMRMRDRGPGIVAGDCIDCRSCVATCPTGTDIRRGLQVECIGSAQCIDACDAVMVGIGKPPGLIRYSSLRQQSGGERRILRPRTLVYLALLTIAWGSFAGMLLSRGVARAEIGRGGREPYRLLPGGEVASEQRVRITNQLTEPQRFTLTLVSPEAARLTTGGAPVEVPPDGHVAIRAVTNAPADLFVDGQLDVRYRLTSDRGFDEEIAFVLLGPYTAAGGGR